MRHGQFRPLRVPIPSISCSHQRPPLTGGCFYRLLAPNSFQKAVRSLLLVDPRARGAASGFYWTGVWVANGFSCWASALSHLPSSALSSSMSITRSEHGEAATCWNPTRRSVVALSSRPMPRSMPGWKYVTILYIKRGGRARLASSSPLCFDSIRRH